jgi:hypothetical protein
MYYSDPEDPIAVGLIVSSISIVFRRYENAKTGQSWYKNSLIYMAGFVIIVTPEITMIPSPFTVPVVPVWFKIVFLTVFAAAYCIAVIVGKKHRKPAKENKP